MRKYFFLWFLFLGFTGCGHPGISQNIGIKTGADRTEAWLPILKNKRIALVGNQTSEIDGVHLLDSMLSLELQVSKVFSPEHGFRGKADAGEQVRDGKDSLTGIPIISLYGNHKKPQAKELADIDIIVFDIQDVGVRFYTYSSTMHLVMEACAENGKELLIFDRPNPNGSYIDGPILNMDYQSFVGMHPVPLIHGMTLGEYAGMINGERWLRDSMQCRLTVIPCANYSHDKEYILPVPPSPNLPNQQAIYLYPSLGLFEGTKVSVARGTPFPFQAFGNPDLNAGNFYFTPVVTPGAAQDPKYKGEECRGKDLRNFQPEEGFTRLYLGWLKWAYAHEDIKEKFFNDYFVQLAGTPDLKRQIEENMSEDEIRNSWEEGLEDFKLIREEYLLYR